LAKNVFNDSISSTILARLEKLIEDRENRPYLDQLYYQVGSLHEKNDSISLAIAYYNKSIQSKGAEDKQKSYTYENLGNLYFKNSEYKFASSYYDSVLSVSADDLSLRVRRVKRKHKNLASLIKFEEVVTINDSIVKIAAMSKDMQEAFFQNYINNLKKKDEDAAQMRLNQIAFSGSSSNSLQSVNKGKWYFYNSQSLGFGKTEFQKIWGNRKLEDNWRWSSNATFGASDKDTLVTPIKDTRYDLASYLERIPKEKGQIDTLKLNRNEALYELGIIYKEQFKNKQLAIERLERVVTLNPRKNLVLPINWHLYQVYKDLGEIDKANIYKNIILTEYANTPFAQRIRNPDKEIEEDVKLNDIEVSYKECYYLYKKGAYEEVVTNVNKLLPSISSSKLKPKFELLKAYAIGKHLSKETYKEVLEFISINYGNTEEGKKAKEILNQLNK
jgi:tetratricopeptide (TPR) repeat protein